MALIKIKQVDGLITLSTSVTTNTTSISDLVIVDSALSTSIADNDTDIANLVIVDSALSTSIADNDTDIANLVIVDSALSTDIAALEVVDSALSTSIAALSHTMDEEIAFHVSTNNYTYGVNFDPTDVLVFVNGVKIEEKDYTLGGGNLVFGGVGAVGYDVESTDEVIIYGRLA